jgi:hypothetical protein
MATWNEFDAADVRNFLKARGKARGETINCWIKNVHVLAELFRHTGDNRMEAHRLTMTDVCIIVQYEIEGNHPFFDNLKVIIVFFNLLSKNIKLSIISYLVVRSTSNRSHLIFLAPNLLFLSKWQLTFASCVNQTHGEKSVFFSWLNGN